MSQEIKQLDNPYSVYDIGFDTQLERWFFHQWNKKYQVIGSVYGSNIVIKDGSGFQLGWVDNNPENPKYFWHVRERYWGPDLKEMSQRNDTIHLTFEKKYSPTTIATDFATPLPTEAAFVDYAFHLTTGKGFLEIKDTNETVLKTLDNRLINVENLNHFTTGEYPKIRLRAKAADIRGLVITGDTIVIVGI